MTGEPGAAKAAAYLARVLKQLNVQAISHANGYYQPFTFQSGFQIQPSGSTLQWQSKPDGNHRQSAILDESFRPLPFSSNGSVEGEVVFAGYGLKVPGEGRRLQFLSGTQCLQQGSSGTALRTRIGGSSQKVGSESLRRAKIQGDGRSRARGQGASCCHRPSIAQCWKTDRWRHRSKSGRLRHSSSQHQWVSR